MASNQDMEDMGEAMGELAKSLQELQQTVKEFSVHFNEVAEINKATVGMTTIFSQM